MSFWVLVIALFASGCAVETRLIGKSSFSSTSPLEFGLSHLNLKSLHPRVYTVEESPTEALKVHINMEEHLFRNKIKFENLPAGATLGCSGLDGNLAVQSADLESGKTLSLKSSYWLSEDSQWLNEKNQDFACWYEVGGRRSPEIQFKVQLHENEILRVPEPYNSESSRKNNVLSWHMSGNGKYLAYSSTQDDLIFGDTNNFEDVFIKNIETGEITLISKSSVNELGNRSSKNPTVSDDGRYVVFESNASNLVENDDNNAMDIFIHDRELGQTSRIYSGSSLALDSEVTYKPVLSGDGRFVAFQSKADDLVVGDFNSVFDIFVYEVESGQITRVSIDSDGVEATDGSYTPAISADGRYIAFVSWASNLVSGDTNDASDVFVHDRVTGQTTRASVATGGIQTDGGVSNVTISADGRYVAFSSGASNLVTDDTNWASDVFVHDRQLGATSRISIATDGSESNGESSVAALSGDGRFVVFSSSATNLVADDVNNMSDVFLRDRDNNTTIKVSVSVDGEAGNGESNLQVGMSTDGLYVVFSSAAENLVPGDYNKGRDVFIFDRTLTYVSRITEDSIGGSVTDHSSQASMSADGRYTVFASLASNLVEGDMNGVHDVFVYDRTTGVTTRVSVASDGGEGNFSSWSPGISANGRYVVFHSSATNLVVGDTNGMDDIFLHDRETGQTVRVSVDSNGAEANGISQFPAISANGRYVTFQSDATNLVVSDTNGVGDIFVHDRESGETTRVSVTTASAQAVGGYSSEAKISSEGRYVVFSSTATNLVVGDTNARSDIFIHDRDSGETTRISVATGGAQAGHNSSSPNLSADGRYITFTSSATNLVVGDSNGQRDIFVHDRSTGETTRVSVASDGTQGNGTSSLATITSDGRYVLFQSIATNLVVDDTNENLDIFIHDRSTGKTERVSLDSKGVEAKGGSSGSPKISADGRYIVFESAALNLSPGETQDGSTDIFIKKFATGL